VIDLRWHTIGAGPRERCLLTRVLGGSSQLVACYRNNSSSSSSSYITYIIKWSGHVIRYARSNTEYWRRCCITRQHPLFNYCRWRYSFATFPPKLVSFLRKLWFNREITKLDVRKMIYVVTLNFSIRSKIVYWTVFITFSQEFIWDTRVIIIFDVSGPKDSNKQYYS